MKEIFYVLFFVLEVFRRIAEAIPRKIVLFHIKIRKNLQSILPYRQI